MPFYNCDLLQDTDIDNETTQMNRKQRISKWHQLSKVKYFKIRLKSSCIKILPFYVFLHFTQVWISILREKHKKIIFESISNIVV